MAELFHDIRYYLKSNAENINSYEKISDWNIVFLGDSITGLDKTSTSIPNIIHILSEANTFDLGIGGMAATTNETEKYNLDVLVHALIEKNTNLWNEEEKFTREFKRFVNEYEETEKICFVINYGLNDYFKGYEVEDTEDYNNVETYAGALINGIDLLKSAYPYSKIVLMSPTYIYDYEQGTKVNSEVGSVLSDYLRVSEKIANQKKVYFKNNYRDLNINRSNYAMYIDDEVHFNGKGRWIFAKQLMTYLELVFCE